MPASTRSAATIGTTTASPAVPDVSLPGVGVPGEGTAEAGGADDVGDGDGDEDGPRDGDGLGEEDGVGVGLRASTIVKAYESRASSPSSAENDVQRTSYSPGARAGRARRYSRGPSPSPPPSATTRPEASRTTTEVRDGSRF